jgi:hypothetical protein
MMMALTDWLSGLTAHEQALLKGDLTARLGYLLSLSPEPIRPAFKPTAYWLAQLDAAWVTEGALYEGWFGNPAQTYACFVPFAGLRDAWLASGDSRWLNLLLDGALRWCKTAVSKSTDTNAPHVRSCLDDMRAGREIAIALLEAHDRGVVDARLDDLTVRLIAIWTFWQERNSLKRLFTHAAWHSYVMAYCLGKLDDDTARQGQYADVMTWALQRIEAQYTKTTPGWRYMFDDSDRYDRPIKCDGWTDVTHAMSDVAALGWLAWRGDATATAWIPRMVAMFRAAYHPERQRFSYLTTGTNDGNATNDGKPRAAYDWPHLFVGAPFAWLGAIAAEAMALCESYATGEGDYYRAPMFAALAVAATKWEHEGTN